MYGLGFSFIEKVKIRYGFGFNPLKSQNKAIVRIHFIEYKKNKVWLWICFIENAEIK